MASVEERKTSSSHCSDDESNGNENSGVNIPEPESEVVKSKESSEDSGEKEVTANTKPQQTSRPEDTSTSVSLSGNTEYASYKPGSKQECWAITTFKAPYYEPSARADVDIVAVIDKSGSMSGQKIALVRKTLEFVIDQCKLTEIVLILYVGAVPIKIVNNISFDSHQNL